MTKTIRRVENPERMKPVAPEKLLSQYGEVLKDLPGKAFHGPGAPLNVFGTLVHSPEIAKLFFPYWVKSKTLLRLTPVEQEYIILRMACLFGSDYVWGHHVLLIKEAGVSDADIAKIPLPPETAGWSPKLSTLMIVVDELVKKANISEDNWKRILEFYSKEQILDIITVVSQYQLFCSVNNVFGVKLEQPSIPRLPDI